MKTGSRIRAALGAVTVTMLAIAMLAPAGAAAAGKGNGDGHGHGGAKRIAAQACKHGGWRELQRADGTRFRNQGRCVSYAVHGGVLSQVVPAVTITFVPSVDPATCDATATLVDFDLAATYEGSLVVDALPTAAVPVTTDALGDAIVPLGAFVPLQVLTLTVDGTSSVPTEVACPVI